MKNWEMSMDVMMLVVFVYNIGVLFILMEVERYFEVFVNFIFLEVVIDKLFGWIGVSIMCEWVFGDVFVDVVKYCKDLSFILENVFYVDFVRVGVVLVGFMES